MSRVAVLSPRTSAGCVSLLLGLASPPRAAADLPPPALSKAATPTSVEGSWDLRGAASADTSYSSAREDAGSVGAALGWGYQLDGSDCRTLDMEHGARWQWRDTERGAMFSGRTEVCMDRIQDDRTGRIHDFPRIEAGYDLATGARPRLDAPRTYAVDDYSLYRVWFDFGAYEQRSKIHRITAARIGTRADAILQGQATTDEPSQGLLLLDFASYSYERRRDTATPYLLDVGHGYFRFDGTHETWLIDAIPISVRNWNPTGDLRLSLGAGYTFVAAPTRRLHVPTATARVDKPLATALGPIEVGAGFARTVLPAVDPVVIVDDRVTASASYALFGGSLVASGFAATAAALAIGDLGMREPGEPCTRVGCYTAADRRDFTGGGSLTFSRDFTKYLTWRAALEVGRSFYGRLDREMVDTTADSVDTVARASTSLEARFGP